MLALRARSHFTDLVVQARPSPAARTEPIFARELSTRALKTLRSRLRADPRMFVAQEAVVLSTVPTFAGDELRRPTFGCARTSWLRDANTKSCPVPLACGGHGESSASRSGLAARAKTPGCLAGGPVSTFSSAPVRQRADRISRGGGDSRAASPTTCFGSAATPNAPRAGAPRPRHRRAPLRLKRAHQSRADRRSRRALRSSRSSRRRCPTPARQRRRRPKARAGWLAAAERCLRVGASTSSRGHSQATVGRDYRVARTVRDRISTDTWRTLAAGRRRGAPRARHHRAQRAWRALGALNRVVTALAAISGLSMDSMTRGQAWRFLDMGRRLERALYMVSLFQESFAVGCTQRCASLEAMLEVADSSMTYRRRYLATLQVAPVVDLLLRTIPTRARSSSRLPPSPTISTLFPASPGSRPPASRSWCCRVVRAAPRRSDRARRDRRGRQRVRA